MIIVVCVEIQGKSGQDFAGLALSAVDLKIKGTLRKTSEQIPRQREIRVPDPVLCFYRTNIRIIPVISARFPVSRPSPRQ